MITAKAGLLLSNGVFLQDGDNVKVSFVSGDTCEGRIAHFYAYSKGMVLISENNNVFDIDFENEYIKNIQLAH